MHVLSLKIIDQAGRAGYQLDRLDLEITITEAMTETERRDMSAMIDFLADQNQGASYIMASVGHDLIGYKERRQADLRFEPAPVFRPRSADFVSAIEKWSKANEQASANQPASCRSL
jgi:hypothetical protein